VDALGRKKKSETRFSRTFEITKVSQEAEQRKGRRNLRGRSHCGRNTRGRRGAPIGIKSGKRGPGRKIKSRTGNQFSSAKRSCQRLLTRGLDSELEVLRKKFLYMAQKKKTLGKGAGGVADPIEEGGQRRRRDGIDQRRMSKTSFVLGKIKIKGRRRKHTSERRKPRGPRKGTKRSSKAQ